MRTIAMYLPQFHNIPENDEWWGEGFTDWVAARNGKKLSEGHYQPHVPLGEKYYDLIKDEEILYEQAEMMHRYGIDAMCFYHYYFKDGKKLLEKPAEKLLANKDIDMSFCFSWGCGQHLCTGAWSPGGGGVYHGFPYHQDLCIA